MWPRSCWERLGTPATPLLLSVVQELAQGNPFFVDELIDAMQQGGQIIQQDDGRWQVAPGIFDILRAAEFLVDQDGEPVLDGGGRSFHCQHWGARLDAEGPSVTVWTACRRPTRSRSR